MIRQLEKSAVVPVVSVILPVFNAVKYIQEAVNSIIGQTFSNFELIIINDGSTDGTLEILKQLAKLDDRVVLISRENRGISETLNEGIRAARGQWIAIMNADDIALANRFERQLHWLEKTGADICGGWIKFFGAVDNRILKHPQSDQAIKMGLLFGSMFAQPTVMMKTELVRQLWYDKTWKVAEDYDLWERAARAGWKMTNVPEVLLLYRQHVTQISTCTASDLQFLTQKVRRRYWEFIFGSWGLEYAPIYEVLKLREPSPPLPNMDDVDSAFIELLQRNRGEAQATIFDHMTRLYYRAAASCPEAMTRWGKLNERFGVGSSLGIKIRLWFLSAFKIRPDGIFFQKIKKCYFWLRRV